MIKGDGIFVGKDAVVDYLNDYGETLDAPILFDTQVMAVRRVDDVWYLETNIGEFQCTQLIVATGRERQKTIPIWPGMEDFGGKLIHSADFGDPSDYDGKKVLVIGAGNSGSDVLNHLSCANPDKVWISVRHGAAVLPSRIFGYPMHGLADIFLRMPKWSLDPVFALMQRVFIGDLRRLGLRRHKMGGGSRRLKQGITFAIDDGFVEALKSYRFDALSKTVGFSHDEVEMRSGRKVQPDVVICATGYRAGLEDVFGHLSALNDKGYPLHPSGQMDPRIYHPPERHGFSA